MIALLLIPFSLAVGWLLLGASGDAHEVLSKDGGGFVASFTDLVATVWNSILRVLGIIVGTVLGLALLVVILAWVLGEHGGFEKGGVVAKWIEAIQNLAGNVIDTVRGVLESVLGPILKVIGVVL